MPFYLVYRVALLLLLLAASHALQAQQTNPQYNKALADSLGGDENGMKKYVLAILKTGPAQVTEKRTRDSLFAGHMANIDRLAKEGKLVVAGPLQKNDRSYRGIFVLNTASLDEARQMVDTDPAVKAGVFEVELFAWYGSAALPMYLPYHSQVSKTL